MSRRNDNKEKICIPSYSYIHILDQSTNVTTCHRGPEIYHLKDCDRLVLDVTKMIVIPPGHFCIIDNPVVRNNNRDIVVKKSGEVELLHGDQEIRLSQDAFPLYPGESLKEGVSELTVVAANEALRLRALLDFTVGQDQQRKAGDEWLFKGPGTYIPRKEVAVEETIKGSVVKPNQAIKLRARKECTDREGVQRVMGEEWLVKKTGAYLPDAYEEVVNIVDITTLTNRQYCIVLDPVDDNGKPQLGRKKLIKGDMSFFLMPGERLENGIQDVYVLDKHESLILKALQEFTDKFMWFDLVTRQPGQRWTINGPKEYVPPVEVEVVCRQKAIPLSTNEGIYVRDIPSGQVRAVCGKTYMLTQDEELWEKDLPSVVEELLLKNIGIEQDRGATRGAPVSPARDKTRVVTFRVSHNEAVLVCNYKEKKARVVMGPDVVMLEPEEQFGTLNLSGGKPKKPNQIKSLSLRLGPNYCNDIVDVETADHTLLQLELSYKWHFDISKREISFPALKLYGVVNGVRNFCHSIFRKERDNHEELLKLFIIPDFVGYACNAIAARIRDAVSHEKFDNFHKNSAEIVSASVFGRNEKKINDSFLFSQNNLVINSVEVLSVKHLDKKTQESMQMHVSKRLEMKTTGLIELQEIFNKEAAERARKKLLDLQQVELTLRTRREKQEAQFIRDKDYQEVKKTKELAAVEVEKLSKIVQAVGPENLKAIFTAGPEMQVKLLQSLGLKSTLIIGGHSHIDLQGTLKDLMTGGFSGGRNEGADQRSASSRSGSDGSGGRSPAPEDLTSKV